MGKFGGYQLRYQNSAGKHCSLKAPLGTFDYHMEKL